MICAIERGAERYFRECESAIERFSQDHFLYPGTWHINKRAFGWDLAKMPANLIWTPFYVLMQVIGFACLKLKLNTISDKISHLPSGLNTQVQAHVRNLIYTELLGSPSHPQSCSLYRFISEEIIQVAGSIPSHLEPSYFDQTLQRLIKQTLEQYSITRISSADIANTMISTAAGALVFKQFTPGGLGLGIVLASIIAKASLSADFIFGATLGHYYYALFPPEPSFGMIVLSTLSILLSLSIIAAFSGLLTDPIQHYLGIHQRRLRKMLKHMSQDFKQQSVGSFHPKDQYLARIMELFDAIKTHIT